MPITEEFRPTMDLDSMSDDPLRDLSDEQQEALEASLETPLAWASSYINNPKSHQPFEPNVVQVQTLGSMHRYNVVRVHRRAGKCLVDSDRVYLADGSCKTAGELAGTTFDLLTCVDGKFKKVSAIAFNNGVEDVYEITLASGRRVTRNAYHPFYKGMTESVHQSKPIVTPHGWTETASLRVGDLIAAPINLPYLSPGVDVSDDEIKLVAYLIGDGGVSSKSGIRFTQKPGAQLTEMFEVCKNLGITMSHVANYDWRLTGVGQPKNTALEITRQWDIQGKNAFEKSLPAQFFQFTREQTVLFLSRLYSTDGWASHKPRNPDGTHRGAGQIGYCSVSRRLIDDVQHMLLRLGVNSRIDYKAKTKSYTLSIDNFEDIIAFVERIGIYGKELACQAVYRQALTLREKKYGRSESLAWEEGSLYKRYEDIGKDRKGEARILRRKIDVTPWHLKNAPAGMRWETIKSVKKLPKKQQTVSITVPECQTYLTDFYEHNTTSLVIIALYFLTTMENCEITYVAPRNNQVQAFWDEMERYIDEHDWIREQVTGGRQKPFSKNFSNGSVIKGFTTGAASNNKGDSIRGQGGDVVLLDEVGMMSDDDFPALTPIIEGDEYRRFPPIVYAASTPAGAFGQFFEWCMDKSLGWHEIFVPITENPKYSDARRARIRKQCSQYTWEQEYLCEFKDAGAGVFPVSLVMRAKRGIAVASIAPMPEYAVGSITYKPYPQVEVAGQPPVRRVWRAMGVDWDKYNADGSGPNIAIIEVDERPAYGEFPGGSGIPEVIYRESIPQGPFVYNSTIKRIKELNEVMMPDVIACDAGSGECVSPETAITTLHGIKKIKDINVGDQVLSIDGRYHAVTAVMINQKLKQTYRIKVAKCLPIDVSETHPVYALNPNGAADWKYAGHLKKGDKVGIPKIKSAPACQSLVIDLLDYVKHVKGIYANETHIWTDNNFNQSQDCRVLRHVDILSKDFLRFAGWYLSEGHANTSGLEITQASSRKEWIDDICVSMHKVFGKKPSVRYREDTRNKNNSDITRVSLHSIVIGTFCTSFFGQHAADKHIPSILMEHPSKLGPLVQTLYWGDGSLNDTSVAMSQDIGLCSQFLIEQVRMILISQNLVPNLYHHTYENPNKQDQYVLKFSGNSEEVSRFNAFTGLAMPNPPRRNRSCITYGKHHVFVPVRKIIDTGITGGLMDITVEDAHSFVGNGILLHNSQIEELKLWGKQHPTTRLDKIVKRVHFGGDVEIADPVTGETVKKQFKGFMVNLLGKWLEDDMLIYNKDDTVFEKQLKGFKEVSRTLHGVRYSKTNEHIIDAVGLACGAMFMMHKNPFKRRVPSTSYLMPSPELVAGAAMTKEQREEFARRDPVTGALIQTHMDKDFIPETRVKVSEVLHVMTDTPTRRSSVAANNPFARNLGQYGGAVGSGNTPAPRARARF